MAGRRKLASKETHKHGRVVSAEKVKKRKIVLAQLRFADYLQ